MATFIQHNQDVWNRQDLTTEQKLVLNYCWAWKARGNPITVTDTYLSTFYNIKPLDLTQIWLTLQGLGLIEISYIPGGPRIIHCNPLDTQKQEGPDDIFDHLY